MANILQHLTKSSHGIPKLAVGVLLVLFGVGFFSVGFDQGQLFSLIEGPQAYGDMYLHEFSHDMRHASGFPCHQISDMKAFLFLGVVLVAGFSAGIIHGLVNLAVVEPYLDNAIGIENQHLFQEGKAQDTPKFWEEFSTYRLWQKEGSIISGGMLGLSTGALFGVVFAYSRNALPSDNYIKKALVLAGIMWFTIFFIPFLKYPANPPTVGDPNTIVFRETAYVAFILLSGLGALGFSRLYKKMQKNKKFAILGYAVYISIVFVLMPPNPDPINAPMNLVNEFRLISATTMTLYWVVNGIILGFLWKRFQPHLENKQVLK